MIELGQVSLVVNSLLWPVGLKPAVAGTKSEGIKNVFGPKVTTNAADFSRVFWGFLKQIISLSLTPSPCLNQASTVKSSLLLRDLLFLLLPVISISISISPFLSNTSSIFYLSLNHRNLISICSPSAVLLICLFLNLSIQLNTCIKCMSTISNSYWKNYDTWRLLWQPMLVAKPHTVNFLIVRRIGDSVVVFVVITRLINNCHLILRVACSSDFMQGENIIPSPRETEQKPRFYTISSCLVSTIGVKTGTLKNVPVRLCKLWSWSGLGQ